MAYFPFSRINTTLSEVGHADYSPFGGTDSNILETILNNCLATAASVVIGEVDNPHEELCFQVQGSNVSNVLGILDDRGSWLQFYSVSKA